MPITMKESMGSQGGQDGQDPQRDFLYDLYGSDDQNDLSSYLIANTALTVDTASGTTLQRQNWELKQEGTNWWKAKVMYRPPGGGAYRRDVGSVKITVDTTGGTQHFTTSRFTVNSYAIPGRTPDDYKGAIGVTRHGVDGVDFPVPVLKLTATKVFAITSLPNLTNLFKLTGHTNELTFTITDTLTGERITFGPNECLFRGIRKPEPRPDGAVEYTYEFEGSPSVTGLTVGDITGIAKTGWDYLWFQYEDSPDVNVVVKRPVAAYVEHIVSMENFSPLLIGIYG